MVLILLLNLKYVKFVTLLNKLFSFSFFSKKKFVAPFDLIHCDIWRKYHTSFSNGAHYFLTSIDDYIRSTWIYAK